MNVEHANFGQSYRLSHLAIRLRTFTAREIIALTGMVEDTVYGFLARLTRPGYLQWEELPRSTRGRPVKRYTLTEEGLSFLLQRNAGIAAALRGEEAVVPSLDAGAAESPAAAAATLGTRVAADNLQRRAHLYRVLQEKSLQARQSEAASKRVAAIPQYKTASSD